MLSPDRRAHWWQWALFSVAVSLLLVVTTTVGYVALLLQGVDLMDYVLLRRPPFIREGAVAAVMGLLLAGQALGPLLMMALFPPARVVAFAGLRRPADPGATYRRAALGAVGALLLQIIWSSVGPAPAENSRVVEHLVYAVVGGGHLWPMLWLTVSIGLVGPLAEEVLYRGFMFGMLRRRWGFWPGAVTSAVMFGLSHGLTNAVPAVLLGIYFAYQAERDGTLCGAILLHVLNNLGVLVAMAAMLP